MARSDMSAYYVDNIGYEVKYYLGNRELGLILTGEMYHHFNGFMLMAIL